MYYCGFDQGTKSIAVCVSDERGKVLYEGEVTLDRKEISKIVRRFKKLSCVVEAGPLAETLCNVVEELGCNIDIAESRRAASVFKTKRKTDKIDVRKLASLARTKWYTRVHRKSAESRVLRTYLTARVQLVKTAGALQSSIRGLLRANGIVLGKGSFTLEVKTALRKCDPLIQQSVLPMLEGWELLHKREKELYRNLERKVVNNNEVARRLSTTHCIGPATAAAYMATIDDPRRFKESSCVPSYLGMVPSVYQSADTQVRGRITKDGDQLTRWLLNEAATSLLTRCRKKSALRTWGLELKDKKGFGKARSAVARKMALILHKLWISNKDFDPEYTRAAG